MSNSTTGQDRIIAVGDSALRGWRGSAAGIIAKPVAKHSRFTQEQVKAFLGLLVIAYAAYRLAKPIVASLRGT